MDQEMTFSLSYEQLTRFAERRIRECNLDSQGAIYLCESAKAGAVLIFWHELYYKWLCLNECHKETGAH